MAAVRRWASSSSARGCGATDSPRRSRSDTPTARSSASRAWPHKIRAFAKSHRLPDVRTKLEYGAIGDPELLKYGPPPGLDHFRKAGIYAGKILSGADRATLPIELPMTFRLEVNLKTARARDLSIPESILVWADEIIE